MIPENSSLIVTNRNYHFHDVHNSSLATIYTHSICINTIYTHIFEIFTDQISSWLIAKRCTQPSKFICSSNHTTKSIAKLVFHTYYHEIHRDMDKNKWYWILACNRMVATTNSTPTLSAALNTISLVQTAHNKVNPNECDYLISENVILLWHAIIETKSIKSVLSIATIFLSAITVVGVVVVVTCYCFMSTLVNSNRARDRNWITNFRQVMMDNYNIFRLLSIECERN